ncbi:hybrid sensor histidine kinase/response regulator [Salinarimonas ramus]|uniref:histidine kinase n=1 Tax=Salinarimonas ramus TaxID=690164 RepID=A0A917QAM7_9HYPH|nr:NahK/ErcS family hybrid sensor histidine kinase/response regulator [Salinarimonas ramus]GGK38635.1 histidine kinase [Salinarimonas ramus]
MVAGWAVVVTALLYLSLLFAVAHWGDRSGASLVAGRARPWVYALALAVYCTSWTFYGSVGLATGSGLDFLMIYVGPILVFVFGHRALARIVRIAKDQNITSVADFVAARYGKSERVAALVCLIAVVGSLPYIALQLKAVSSSLDVFLAADETMAYARTTFPLFGDLAFIVAAVLAFFAVGFGTRHADATEHQDGLVLAISLESVVKLVAFLMVGFWTVATVFGGLPGLIERLAAPEAGLVPVGDFLGQTSSPGYLATLALLSAIAIVMLPRQFHMGVVENREPDDLRRAAWLFPLYLVLINVFVVPIAIAGADALAPGAVDADMTVLGIPLSQGAGAMALVAFIGGLSAATAMVIVESVALAIMISNHLVIPLVLRRRGAFAAAQPGERGAVPDDLGGFVLVVRRIAIVAMIMLAYLYYRAAGDAALAAIGLLAFAALAQIAPAFIGGLVWGRGTAAGAAAGLTIGFLVWAYTLMLPSIAWHSPIVDDLLAYGLFGIDSLRPTSLFGSSLPELTHGVVWSLGLNVAAYVLVSLARPMTALERLQAAAYMPVSDAPATPSFRFFRAVVTVDELRASVARYLGEERANRSFEGFASARGARLDSGAEADIHLLRYAEHLLASAIGAASARLALSLVLKRRNVSTADALRLLDDASAAIQANRDLLQHALDHARQGITVLDSELHILCWNRAFVDLYDLPPEFVRVGVSLDEIVRFNAQRGSYGPGVMEQQIAARIHSFVHDTAPVRLRLYPQERVIEIRTTPLPDGGYVTTYTDVTEAVIAEEARARNAIELERRVAERTEELTRLNEALTRAKAEAEEANASKTRFLAAASHDILQPLNAARLYATSLVERDREGGDATLAENVDASLDAVEEILTALLDISRLDTGAMKPQWSSFRLDEMFRQLAREFEPVAAEKGLRLRFVVPSLTVRSDRRLLRRLLQNLISNAIKYTPSGTVLVGARRRNGRLRVDVLDTGLGIPQSKQRIVFREFHRLDQGAKVARGLGLGLSIVERIARVLDHKLDLASESGRGSRFSVLLPVVAPLPAMALPAEAPAAPAMPLAGLRVLAIDNEPAILEGMRTLLGGWGCRITVAASLDEATERLRAEPNGPDVVIADYHLDEGTGIEAIVALRWKLGDLPAILLTADRTLPVRDEAAEKHIHVLNKPLKPAALRALLARWRAERRAAAE